MTKIIIKRKGKDIKAKITGFVTLYEYDKINQILQTLSGNNDKIENKERQT